MELRVVQLSQILGPLRQNGGHQNSCYIAWSFLSASSKCLGCLTRSRSVSITSAQLLQYKHICNDTFLRADLGCLASHPNYAKYSSSLSPGWIPGRKFDDTDAQYSTFRENIPYMLVVLVLHPLLRRLYDFFITTRDGSVESMLQAKAGSYSSQVSVADDRLTHRVTFDLYFALIFICALNGFSALKVFMILYVNFTLATRLPKEYIPSATWFFNIGMLFANELCDGYSYASLANTLSPWSPYSKVSTGNGFTDNWGSFLDSYGGLNPRWHILFKITTLRLVSFNLDYYWSLGRGNVSPVEVSITSRTNGYKITKADYHKKKQLDPRNLSERDRVDSPAKQQDYSFRNYLAYVLYSPLYLAGPILTFNDYISQQRYQPQSITTSRTLLYGIRFLICLLSMEIMLHYIYVVAISKANPAWELYTPFELSMLGYFNLHIIWLKLLLPWRFFRFWALLDGMDPPENMVRCMSDNYSAPAFWRAWHRSYNRWIVRYIYIPLGGSGTYGFWGNARAVFNYLVVFTFVALWHDISMKLLMWGWLITIFILPEALASYLFPKRRWQNHKTAYRVICGIGAVANILMMMVANLVGFALGLDGLQGLVHGIAGSYSGELSRSP